MKKTVRVSLVIAFMLALFAVLPNQVSAAADTTAPVVDASSVTISKTTISMDETTVISIRITDDTKVEDALVWIAGVGQNSEAYGGVYNSKTDKWEFEVSAKYFGKNEIEQVNVTDQYGNYRRVFNSKCDKVYSDMSGEEYADFSKGDFTVSSGLYAQESDSPVINFSTLNSTNKSPKLGETIYFRVKISDASPIAYTYITYGFNATYLGGHGVYNSSTGYYEFQIDCNAYGEYQIFRISAEDAFGNRIEYYDNEQSLYEKHLGDYTGDATWTDLSAANSKVEGGSNDTAAPVLDVSSIRIEKMYLKKGEHTTVSFKIYDDSEIDLLMCDVWCGLNTNVSGFATSCSYNKKTDRYEVDVDSFYYGTNQIFAVRLTDAWGNRMYYADVNSDAYNSHWGSVPDGDWVNTDLSATTYYVGLFNRSTGTFVSNSTFNSTSKLKVNELDENSDAYKRLSEKGYNIKGFYEVDVNGKCDMSSEDSNVCFDAPEGFKEGDRLRIRHLLHDGSVQTENAVVRKGKIRIAVREFSPFMIEIKKSQDKNLFVKKGIVYQVINKKEVKVIGPEKKSLKSLVIPSTVKAFNKTYSVAEIDKKAFSGCKKLKSITIGKNIKKIGEKAFYSCKKVKKIIVNSKKLTAKKIGKKAFKGLSKKVKIQIPKGKKESYAALFK